MTMPDAVETPSEVRYPIPRFAKPNRRTRRVLAFVYAFLVAMAILEVSTGRLPLVPALTLVTAVFTRWRIRSRGRDAVASAEGISGPHLRRPIRWCDVSYLVETSRYDPEVYVILSDGSRKGTGFPPSYFDQLSALAHVPTQPRTPFG